MVGVICLIVGGAAALYNSGKTKEAGFDKIAMCQKIIGALSVAAGVILGIALLAVLNY